MTPPPPDDIPEDVGKDGTETPRRQAPGFLSKLSLASHIYGLKGILSPILWIRDWTDYFYPPSDAPNIVKVYECRPQLPVRVFFPKSYDQTSPITLPTVFTIHGGGFCIGHIRDDDEWNRAFADEQNVLVIALNYSKAPGAPYPTAVHDIEALLLAILADESLPIDRTTGLGRSGVRRSRTAILGFSAGGNLSLAVSQLPSIHAHPLAPAAAVSVYGYINLSVPPEQKRANRPWKAALPRPRSAETDGLMTLIPAFDWSYIPYGHNLRDPVLSPFFAPRNSLPPFVGFVAAELDILAHENWQLACRLAREGGEAHGTAAASREIPDPKSEDKKWSVCGSEDVKSESGQIDVLDETGKPDDRFGFEENWEDGGVKWMLIPDVLHGFDNKHVREYVGGENTIEDAEAKTKVMMDRLGIWLKTIVW